MNNTDSRETHEGSLSIKEMEQKILFLGHYTKSLQSQVLRQRRRFRLLRSLAIVATVGAILLSTEGNDLVPPKLIKDGDQGLGDVVKRALAAVGIKPCGACLKRARLLNRLLPFTSRKRPESE